MKASKLAAALIVTCFASTTMLATVADARSRRGGRTNFSRPAKTFTSNAKPARPAKTFTSKARAKVAPAVAKTKTFVKDNSSAVKGALAGAVVGAGTMALLNSGSSNNQRPYQSGGYQDTSYNHQPTNQPDYQQQPMRQSAPVVIQQHNGLGFFGFAFFILVAVLGTLKYNAIVGFIRRKLNK